MKFWKEHVALRLALMALTFAAGMVLLIAGWQMTGRLLGLGLMILGVALLLICLALYNKPFADTKRK